ncbi:MAG TPA: hypothetical protein VFC21_07440 [Bryobacteraceae bacterium]|nr:hypothetical protein [Bryobacteraceae bacterium]
MDQDLKLYLDEMKRELRTNNVEDTKREVRAIIEETKRELRADIEEAKREVRADIEKSETNLLRAFHSWARSMEVRVRGVATVSAGVEERIGFMEERLSEVERRMAS